MSTQQPAWVWLRSDVLRSVHAEQLAEHGGLAGIRDPGGLASASPEHLAHDGQPDVADLAAAYGHGLARNHPFVDGNKRTAFVAVELFLALNGYELMASDADCVVTMLALAAGDLPEAAYADWLRHHIVAR